MYTYVNGELVRNEEVRISPFDHGFLYGIGVFETFRTYDGKPFLLEEHIRRLNKGLNELNILLEVTSRQVEEILFLLEKANGWSNAYTRLNISAGEGEIGLQTASYKKPNILVFQKGLKPAGPISEKRAVWLKTKRNQPEGSFRLKSHHYLNNVLGKREAGDDPAVEGLFLTPSGFVAEGVVSNVFWVKEDMLYTPSLETGILNGITRQFIFNIAHEAGLRIEEGLYSPENVYKADEVFVTNSIQEIVPLSHVGDRKFPGIHGPAANELFTLYRKAVRQ